MKYLIDEQGRDPSCLDEDKETPLHYAARKGHVQILNFLTLVKHCDPTSRNSGGTILPFTGQHATAIWKYLNSSSMI